MNGRVISVNGNPKKKGRSALLRPLLYIERSLKIKRQLAEHPHPVIAHLYSIERPAGLTVTPAGLTGIGNDRLVGVYIKEVVDTRIPGQVLGDPKGQVKVRRDFGMKYEVFRHDRLAVIGRDIRIPARAIV